MIMKKAFGFNFSEADEEAVTVKFFINHSDAVLVVT